MGYKSRGNWRIGACLKRCANRGELCTDCFRFSNFKTLFCDEVKAKLEEQNKKQGTTEDKIDGQQ